MLRDGSQGFQAGCRNPGELQAITTLLLPVYLFGFAHVDRRNPRAFSPLPFACALICCSMFCCSTVLSELQSRLHYRRVS